MFVTFSYSADTSTERKQIVARLKSYGFKYYDSNGRNEYHKNHTGVIAEIVRKYLK